MSASPLVSIVNVEKHFGSFHALKDVSLDVRVGEQRILAGVGLGLIHAARNKPIWLMFRRVLSAKAFGRGTCAQQTSAVFFGIGPGGMRIGERYQGSPARW